MQQFPNSIRTNVTQQIGPYTFTDQNGIIIDLSSYSSAYLEVKEQEQLFSVVRASILTKGQVQCNYIFDHPAIWDLQFYCIDSNNNRLYGAILQVRVISNLDSSATEPAPCYSTLEDAGLYFSRRLGTGAWDSASESDRQKALYQATQLIDQLNFAGVKANSNQPLQFPRANTSYNYAGGFVTSSIVTDIDIPQAIMDACAEIALQLLDDIDVNKEMSAVQTKQAHIAGITMLKDTQFVPEWVLAGIPSPIAWNMLKSFLADPLAINITRNC